MSDNSLEPFPFAESYTEPMPTAPLPTFYSQQELSYNQSVNYLSSSSEVSGGYIVFDNQVEPNINEQEINSRPEAFVPTPDHPDLFVALIIT
jgi:hypothetical protein